MKRLTLNRYWRDGERTIGELLCGDYFVCFTLEPGLLHTGAPRVPTGFYYLERHGWETNSPVKFKKTWALVGRDVSHTIDPECSRSAVLIHTGNRDDSTLGCILPGVTIGRLHGETAMISSAEAMTRLRNLLGEADACLVINGG